jgi:hypothetical protein
MTSVLAALAFATLIAAQFAAVVAIQGLEVDDRTPGAPRSTDVLRRLINPAIRGGSWLAGTAGRTVMLGCLFVA